MTIRRRDLLRLAGTTALSSVAFGALPFRAARAAEGGPVRSLTLYSRTQAANPQQYQAAELIAQIWGELGLKVTVQALPNTQLSDVIWYKRDEWDLTMWQMVGRPERSDPDEFVYNLFHSTTAETGYNFVGYQNPEYDKAAEEQRVTADRDARRELIYRAQQIINEDQPYAFLVYPEKFYAYSGAVFDPATVTDQPGLGVKNFWTFIEITPKGDQKDLVMNSSNELNACNPFYISGAQDSWVTELIWDRVMRIGKDGLPQPWAAESVVWNDAATECTITLREGMAWHDGKPVTAEDVVFSFTAPSQDNTAPMYKPFTDIITGIEAPDARTVVMTLDQPNAAFETSTLAKLNIVPKHVWEPLLATLKPGETAESITEESRIGSGPFRFVRWLPQQEIVLEANPEHWAPPKIDRWIMRIVLNVAAGLGMMKSGEMNFMSDYTGDPELLKQAAEEDKDLVIAEAVDIGFQYAAFNCRRPPFDDKVFRRALSFAIPRKLIQNAAWNGFAALANSHVSEALPFWHDPETDTLETGVKIAKAMLEEAGYVISDGTLYYPEGKTDPFSD
ncbi:ABC transporter substrate-binding protein [Oceanicella sp. SM1341]|uniref:ABC transporter substrate-binding protein n=1 Tax=Oceanicella sp. SM1341 TaxID=1548889 RepID=UPI000E47DB3D|nr:ABC transporter substrate-binding protein [Oceanicella sp. SM1341]